METNSRVSIPNEERRLKGSELLALAQQHLHEDKRSSIRSQKQNDQLEAVASSTGEAGQQRKNEDIDDVAELPFNFDKSAE